VIQTERSPHQTDGDYKFMCSPKRYQGMGAQTGCVVAPPVWPLWPTASVRLRLERRGLPPESFVVPEARRSSGTGLYSSVGRVYWQYIAQP
jgi:hypothetical protein